MTEVFALLVGLLLEGVIRITLQHLSKHLTIPYHTLPYFNIWYGMVGLLLERVIRITLQHQHSKHFKLIIYHNSHQCTFHNSHLTLQCRDEGTITARHKLFNSHNTVSWCTKSVKLFAVYIMHFTSSQYCWKDC